MELIGAITQNQHQLWNLSVSGQDTTHFDDAIHFNNKTNGVTAHQQQDWTTQVMSTNITDVTETSSAPAVNLLRDVFIVATAILFIVGLSGNSLTVCVMTTRGFWSKPYSRFVVALAVSDACVNCMVPFNKNSVRQLLHFDVRSLTNHSCRFFYWAWRMAKITSSWMIVSITIERYTHKYFLTL